MTTPTTTFIDPAADRIAEVSRNTAETKITARVNLDGTGQASLSTGIGFFDHMLDQIARHGLIDLNIQCEGDLHIDGHHTVEDVGITLGQAVAKAVGDKKGIRRYGHAYVPLDEALSRVVIDFSGRPGLHMDVPFKAGMIGGFDTQLAFEFFQGFANHALPLALGMKGLLWLAVAVFVLAWIGQFIGHKWEGKRPSFFTDLVYLLIGPLWTLSKLYKKAGIAV